MDGAAFDRMVRRLELAAGRRTLLAGLAAAGLAGGPVVSSAAARPGRKRRKSRSAARGRRFPSRRRRSGSISGPATPQGHARPRPGHLPRLHRRRAALPASPTSAPASIPASPPVRRATPSMPRAAPASAPRPPPAASAPVVRRFSISPSFHRRTPVRLPAPQPAARARSSPGGKAMRLSRTPRRPSARSHAPLRRWPAPPGSTRTPVQQANPAVLSSKGMGAALSIHRSAVATVAARDRASVAVRAVALWSCRCAAAAPVASQIHAAAPARATATATSSARSSAGWTAAALMTLSTPGGARPRP